MARPRKPTAVKKLKGTLQPCRTNKLEPMPETALRQISPPGYLSDAAKALWVFAVQQAPAEMLTSLDFSVMATWADTYAKIIDLEAEIKATGYTIIDDKGAVKVNPAIKLQNELKMIMMRTLTELGFTPASRSKVSLRKTQDGPKNGFLDLDA